MEPEIEALIADGMLLPLSAENGVREYDIPALAHKELTWLGWESIDYRLTVYDDAAPGEDRYIIESDSRDSGGQVLIATNDWIRERAADAPLNSTAG